MIAIQKPGQFIQVVEIGTVKKDILHEYAGWSSLDVLENANRYPGPPGFFAYVMGKALKESLSLVPEEGRKPHFSGDIYIHKLPYSLYIPYCTGHSTARLLEKGLKTPTITSRPAKHYDTYVDHIANDHAALLQRRSSIELGRVACRPVHKEGGP